MQTGQKWNFKVVFNHLCCYGNYKNVTFYLSIKISYQYILHLPSFSLWAATFLLPWFSKWHILTNCQKLCSATLIHIHLIQICETIMFLWRTKMAINMTKNIYYSKSYNIVTSVNVYSFFPVYRLSKKLLNS